jgi:hypothetical protein
MIDDPSATIWLRDRWYGLAARERVRQLALWSPLPILVYRNCGLPYGEEDEVADEVRAFQREGVVRFWSYENERTYDGSLSTVTAGPIETIRDRDYEHIIRFVDTRLASNDPDPRLLGFRNMEGMLLEQVVLRRRYFSQAICGALKVNTLADAREHVDLYGREPDLFAHLGDTLENFFNSVNVPSLLLLDVDEFLQFRQRSQAVLPEIVAEVYGQLDRSGLNMERTRSEAVQHLIRRYELELRELLKRQGGARAAASQEAYQDGTRTQIESRLALFYLSDAISDLTPWFAQTPDGQCKLALLLLEWKAGRFGFGSQYRR